MQGIIIACIIIVIIIMAYGKYRCDHPEFKDPLQTKIYGDLDGWSATHYIFYGVLAYIFPNDLLLIFTIGVIWEMVEDRLGRFDGGMVGAIGMCQISTDNKEKSNWWYGKYSDIVMNTLGLLTGYWLRRCNSCG